MLPDSRYEVYELIHYACLFHVAESSVLHEVNDFTHAVILDQGRIELLLIALPDQRATQDATKMDNGYASMHIAA